MIATSKHRLTRVELANLPRARAVRISGKYFSLVATPLLEQKISKFTCAVSTKAARKAVARNRIKRLCRQAARETLGKVGKPFALVFYARQEAAEASYVDVQRDIKELLSRFT